MRAGQPTKTINALIVHERRESCDEHFKSTSAAAVRTTNHNTSVDTHARRLVIFNLNEIKEPLSFDRQLPCRAVTLVFMASLSIPYTIRTCIIVSSSSHHRLIIVSSSSHHRHSLLLLIFVNLVRHDARYADRGLRFAGSRIARGRTRAGNKLPIHHEFVDDEPIQGARIAFAVGQFVITWIRG